jgi:peroxiredoxin
VIDPAGKVARVFPLLRPAEHSAEVLAALDELHEAI